MGRRGLDMNNRPWAIALGLCLVVLGFLTIARGGFYDLKHGVRIDFGEFHLLVGAFFAVTGALFIYVFWGSRNGNNRRQS